MSVFLFCLKIFSSAANKRWFGNEKNTQMGLCHLHIVLHLPCQHVMLMCKCQCQPTSFRMMWWFALVAWHLCGRALVYPFCRFICNRRSSIIYPTVCCVHGPRETFQAQHSSMKTQSPEGSPVGIALAEGHQCRHDHALIWSCLQHSLTFPSVNDKLPPHSQPSSSPWPAIMRMMSVRVERNTLNIMFHSSSSDNWGWREDPYTKVQSWACNLGFG